MAESVGVTISRFEERVANLKARWYFTKEELKNFPSRAHGVDSAKELSYRQQAASLIKDVGHRIGVGQLCIATAVVYMHRFFIVHSFKAYPRFTVATAALFLAAKVEEQPRKLEHVARVSYACQNRDSKPPDSHSDVCKKLMEEISYHELLLLQTLGFEVAVEHPHKHVVLGTQLVGVTKDLSQTAYFMSHNSLLLTTFCLQYPPTVVACVCIHLACRWKGIEIPLSADGKPWWQYIDKTVTLEQLNDYTGEFLKIYEMCPNKLQKKIMESVKMVQQGKDRSSGGEPSRNHTSRPPSDKPKGPLPHSSKFQNTPHQKQSKSGAQLLAVDQPAAKHPGHPRQHQSSSHAPPHTGASNHHATSTLNGAHHQQAISHNSTHDSKARPSSVAPGTKPPVKHHPRPPTEDPHRHNKFNLATVKHSNSGPPTKPGPPTKHHHHPAAPGHHPSTINKPSESINKHRHATGVEHKHRPNHDIRSHNSLKRPHPSEAREAKRPKLDPSSVVNPPLPPLPTEPNRLLTLPPLPSQPHPPLPPPLPADPPPDFLQGLDCPPPPPPPN